MPGLVAGFNLDQPLLGDVESIFVFAPKYVVGNCFEFIFGKRTLLKLRLRNIFIYKVTAPVGSLD